MKNVKYLAVLVLLGGVIGGFTDKNIKDIEKKCRVASIQEIRPQQNDTFFTFFEYDTAGRIVKESNCHKEYLICYSIYDYSIKGKVDIKKNFPYGKIGEHTIYTLGSNGYANISIDSSSDFPDTILYEYNVENYLIKKINNYYDYILIFDIMNGNVIQDTVKWASGVITSQSTYEYTIIPNKTGLAVGRNLYKDIFFGRASANLVSKITEIGSITKITTYSYTLNEEGYPLEVIETISYLDLTIITKFKYTYTCP